MDFGTILSSGQKPQKHFKEIREVTLTGNLWPEVGLGTQEQEN